MCNSIPSPTLKIKELNAQMEKFKCCENPDMVEVFYNNGKQGHRCWNCGYVFKDGEPHPEYLDIDEDLMNLFMNS